MRRSVGWFLAAISLCLSHSPCALAQDTLVEEQGEIRLFVQSTCSRGVIQIGVADVLTFRVDIKGPDTLEVQVPDLLTRTPGWREWHRSGISRQPAGPGQVRWSQHFELAPLAPSAYALQLEPWKTRERRGAWQTITWKLLAVKVTAMLKEADAKALRDITAIETAPELPAASTWAWLWPWLALGMTVVLIAGGWLVLIRLGPATRPRVSELHWSLQRLDRLAALRIAGPEQMARAHGLLADLIRSHLVRHDQVPARHWTTAELTNALIQKDEMPEEDRSFVLQLLRHCDQVRFARQKVSMEEWTSWLLRTRQLLSASPEKGRDAQINA